MVLDYEYDLSQSQNQASYWAERSSRLKQQVEARDKDIAELQQQARIKDSRITVLQRQLTERDNGIAELQQTLTARDKRLSELQQQSTERANSVSVLRSISQAQAETIAKLEKRVQFSNEKLPQRTFEYLTQRDSQNRLRVWTASQSPEQDLHQTLLDSFPAALRDYSFLWNYEWPDRPSSKQRKGDFVFTDGLSRFAVVECKVLPWTPKSSKKRTAKRKEVRQQAQEIATAMKADFSHRTVVYATYTNDTEPVLSALIEVP